MTGKHFPRADKGTHDLNDLDVHGYGAGAAQDAGQHRGPAVSVNDDLDGSGRE